jgi:hypothetical protein
MTHVVTILSHSLSIVDLRVTESGPRFSISLSLASWEVVSRKAIDRAPNVSESSVEPNEIPGFEVGQGTGATP